MQIKSTVTKTMLAVALLSTSAFALAQVTPTPQEAMKQGNPQAQAAAQSKVDSKGQAVNKSAKQPEAMAQGSDKSKTAAEAKVAAKGNATDKTAKQPEAMSSTSDKAKTAAEAKVAKKAAAVKKNPTDEQMSKDAKKL
jgi:hypothetical protein